ncbi:hypothetical protein ACJBU6_05948 [Exserohilum turcicum]
MAQAQAAVRPAEKLHAACDECRTRKLKCSGDTPACVRCKKEKMVCFYSPQKQMGRPRKKRREGEADESTGPLTEAHDGYANTLNTVPDLPNYPSFDSLVSAPSLQNAYSSSHSSVHEAVTPGQFDFTFPGQFGISPGQDFASNFDLPVDPSLWDLPPDLLADNVAESPSSQHIEGPCACLTTTWLTLTELQAVTSFDFPQVVIPLRKAMSALADIIACPQCPKDPFCAIQNVQSIVSLMKAITERFNKVLIGIDREAARLEETGQKKPYRIGDTNPALLHLHTGTPDCPMGFNIELEAKDWKRLVKTALKTEVYGGGRNSQSLLDLVKKSELRQEKWHNDRHSWVEDMVQLHGGRGDCANSQGCQALGAQHIRRTIDHLRWD